MYNAPKILTLQNLNKTLKINCQDVTLNQQFYLKEI